MPAGRDSHSNEAGFLNHVILRDGYLPQKFERTAAKPADNCKLRVWHSDC